MSRFGRSFEPDQRRLTFLISNGGLARRTRQLRLKLTINSPWETISGFNLTATRREKRPKVQPISLLYSST